MNRHVQLERAVTSRAALFQPLTAKLASRLAQRVGSELGNTQLTSLERLAAVATSPHEVLFSLTERITRHRAWQIDGLGDEVLAALTVHHPEEAHDATRTPSEIAVQVAALRAEAQLGPDEEDQVTLLFYREFLHQLRVQYMYARRHGAAPRQDAPAPSANQTGGQNDGQESTPTEAT